MAQTESILAMNLSGSAVPPLLQGLLHSYERATIAPLYCCPAERSMGQHKHQTRSDTYL